MNVLYVTRTSVHLGQRNAVEAYYQRYSGSIDSRHEWGLTQMCGIVGLAGSNVTQMRFFTAQCDSLRHRGPDASGIWQSPDRDISLGHRRLSVIDLSIAGNQPMNNEDSGLQIVFNGEIYNYLALRAQLEKTGHRFKSSTDTEVLLAAYQRWGPGCLSHIRGMFAFAVYEPAKKTLFLARDRAGEKPLFYCHSAGKFAFASELKALMIDPSFPRRLSTIALDHYLGYGYVPGELCLLDGVKKVPPGHALTYDLVRDETHLWQYWSLPSPCLDSTADSESLVEELDLLLSRSVREQLVADVPVGVLLSGGVDSSLITAMAARVSGAAVRTFTITFPGHGSYDESPYAKMVATYFGTQHTELIAEPATVELLPALARQFDEPIGDSSMVPTYLVSRLVRQACTVALGGDGGDELFGGYMHHSRIQRQLQWRRFIPAPLKRTIGHGASLLPMGIRGRTYLRSLKLRDRDAWAAASLIFDVSMRRRLAPLTRRLSGSPPEEYRLQSGRSGRTTLQRVTSADFLTYLPEDILVKVDRASMLASLEVRAPFLDQDVIEFAFGRVPDKLRATSSERKVLLRMLAARLLPKALDIRRKQGFSLPLEAWFRGSWGVYIADILRSAPSSLFDQVELNRLIKSQNSGRPNAQRLFNLAFLELWRQEYNVQC